MEDTVFANALTEVSNQIEKTLEDHWNGKYLFQTKEREIDGAVMQSIATFKGAWQTASDDKVAKTIGSYNKAFCNEYMINRYDIEKGLPGVLYGRYPGDAYAGGNPWQLISAALAEVFYQAAKEVLEKVPVINDTQNARMAINKNFIEWQNLFKINGNKSYLELSELMKDAGDAVMSRIWKYVKNDNGRIDEQIEQEKGFQYSAHGLTWSYANVLHALHIRNHLIPLISEKKNQQRSKRMIVI